MRVARAVSRALRAAGLGLLCVVAPALPTGVARAAAVPRVLVCAGAPRVRPASLYWCTSECSSYLRSIRWTSWTATGARGVAVRMTNDGVPSCAQGRWTAHPGYVVTLSAPRTVAYCAGLTPARGLLFTESNFFPTPLPAFRPPCG